MGRKRVDPLDRYADQARLTFHGYLLGALAGAAPPDGAWVWRPPNSRLPSWDSLQWPHRDAWRQVAAMIQAVPEAERAILAELSEVTGSAVGPALVAEVRRLRIAAAPPVV